MTQNQSTALGSVLGCAIAAGLIEGGKRGWSYFRKPKEVKAEPTVAKAEPVAEYEGLDKAAQNLKEAKELLKSRQKTITNEEYIDHLFEVYKVVDAPDTKKKLVATIEVLVSNAGMSLDEARAEVLKMIKKRSEEYELSQKPAGS